MEYVDVLVVGAGVVGLAVARELSTIGLEVVVVEAETVVGSITSARNSEVIHAGIYYAPGSLKASLCVSGRRMLYEYCERRGVPFRRRGKLIVATTPEQVERLIAIKARAEVNDVDDLRVLDRAETLRLEPELACVAALVSPSTGIVDSHSFMQSLLGEAQDHGAMVALGSRVQRGEVATGGIRVTIVDASGHTTTLVARRLVNAAGLHAPAVAGAIDGLAPEHVPAAYFAKGNYFSVTGRVPFSRLVYPVPSPGGLGVHLTLDLGGQARFGPDVEWLDVRRAEDIHYAVEPRRADRFYAEIRKYWPGLPDTALEPAFSGVRPKLVPAGAVDGDFVIDGPSRHGVPGLVNLFGIESPGLTAALAIAESVGAELGVR